MNDEVLFRGTYLGATFIEWNAHLEDGNVVIHEDGPLHFAHLLRQPDGRQCTVSHTNCPWGAHLAGLSPGEEIEVVRPGRGEYRVLIRPRPR